MTFRLLAAFLIALQGTAQGERPAEVLQLPAGTPLWIRSDSTVRLRVGTVVTGRLLYAVYAGNRFVLPSGTVVQGVISAETADKAQRLQSRLRGDFTPFRHPVVQFRELVLPDNVHVKLPVSAAVDGAPILRLTPPPPRRGGFLRRQWDTGVEMARDRMRNVTGPGKKDRLSNLLYSQLPYHPQRVPAGTVWTVDTTGPVDVPGKPEASAPAQASGSAATAGGPGLGSTWTLQAYIGETLSSAHTRVGDPIRAIVAEPVLDAGGEIAVPQGAVLQGSITRARPARRFGRAGELRFDFRELTFPGGSESQEVQTSLTGIDAGAGANLSLDREGQVQPRPKDKVIVPFILLALASRPLDNDSGRHLLRKEAVASNSLGVLGFVLGTAAGQPNLAAGIGYYGAAIALWNRWIKRGEDTTLRRDTRLVVQATARRSAALQKPQRAAP